MEEKKAPETADGAAVHIGGVNAALGGVDPEIDELLMRLSGGP